MEYQESWGDTPIILIPFERYGSIAHNFDFEFSNDSCEIFSLEDNLLRPLTSSLFPYILVSREEYIISLERLNLTDKMRHHSSYRLLICMMNSYSNKLGKGWIIKIPTLLLKNIKKALLIPYKYLTDKWMFGCIGLEIYWDFLFFVEKDLIEELFLHIVLRNREIDFKREKNNRTNSIVNKC
jgi:hypothetical protein